MKWNVYNIAEFLKTYKKYPALWNRKDKEHGNSKLKEKLFQCLYNELNEKQLLKGMNMKQLKARIKSIKDVHRQEVHKVDKSKRSGCSSEGVYSPKLAWFSEADYLTNVLVTRSCIKSNLNVQQTSQEIEQNEGSESCKDSVEFAFNPDDPKKLLKKMKPPVTPMKRIKRAANGTASKVATLVVNKTNNAEEKPYEQFGKFIAAELRQLPQRQAILLQEEIHNSIIRSKLLALDHAIYSNSQEALSPNSDQSVATNSAFSNNDDDVKPNLD